MFFSLEKLELRYEPFPIGIARPLMEPGLYKELCERYPSPERCTSLAKVGEKLTLSERFNPEAYRRFLRDEPLWRRFHAWVKSPQFVDMVLRALAERHVDLGFEPGAGGPRRLWRRAADLWRGRVEARSAPLRTRFELSMLPTQGGHVLPHSDGVHKIVTLVVSMLGDDEWDPAWGGGTDLNRPRDRRFTFNRMNQQLGFDEVEVIDTFPFEPNQAVVFVKTFNSWHSVRPMSAPVPGGWRRTLTINVEAP